MRLEIEDITLRDILNLLLNYRNKELRGLTLI